MIVRAVKYVRIPFEHALNVLNDHLWHIIFIVSGTSFSWKTPNRTDQQDCLVTVFGGWLFHRNHCVFVNCSSTLLLLLSLLVFIFVPSWVDLIHLKLIQTAPFSQTLAFASVRMMPQQKLRPPLYGQAVHQTMDPYLQF